MELRNSAVALAGAVMQIAQTGAPNQIAATKKILVDARKGVYQILAEDGEAEAK